VQVLTRVKAWSERCGEAYARPLASSSRFSQSEVAGMEARAKVSGAFWIEDVDLGQE
jgi:hypothetical protein